MGNDQSQSSKHGSSLCHHCQSLDLATISQLKLAHESLSDTIWDRKRKHTWKIEWQDSEEADLQCTLCRILRMYGNRLGAHSAHTFFKCERVENSVLFESITILPLFYCPTSKTNRLRIPTTVYMVE